MTLGKIAIVGAVVSLLCAGCAAVWIGLSVGAGVTLGSMAVSDVASHVHWSHSTPTPLPTPKG